MPVVITARVIARGRHSAYPADPAAVDAEISDADGHPVGEVTLRPGADGELDIWGGVETWACPMIRMALEYAGNRRAATRAIVDAVRKAVCR